jgi:hypothetical protein
MIGLMGGSEAHMMPVLTSMSDQIAASLLSPGEISAATNSVN